MSENFNGYTPEQGPSGIVAMYQDATSDPDRDLPSHTILPPNMCFALFSTILREKQISRTGTYDYDSEPPTISREATEDTHQYLAEFCETNCDSGCAVTQAYSDQEIRERLSLSGFRIVHDNPDTVTQADAITDALISYFQGILTPDEEPDEYSYIQGESFLRRLYKQVCDGLTTAITPEVDGNTLAGLMVICISNIQIFKDILRKVIIKNMPNSEDKVPLEITPAMIIDYLLTMPQDDSNAYCLKVTPRGSTFGFPISLYNE
ncbi:hypothetical protein KC853_00270 [Candidatus Saccharibacteria bacterium]|nr:hypothetical protein [Candidatus Saccharibacteria bacterium]MCB9835052.1 hypothetical protein [Candidatus Nomurabacteria bacterium]